MRKHRLRCFFLSFIFIFYRRNSIGYDVDIVFRLCFCGSKNTIYFLDIQLLRIIQLKKKHLDCLRGSIMTHLRKFVSSVPEYRRTSRGNFKHKLEDILMLVILGRLSKCITRAEILQFGKRHLKRLQAKGLFPYGLPSEATLCRVFQNIDDEKMADRMSVLQRFSARKYPIRQLTSFVLMARPCEVPCMTTDVTLISYLHTHSVRALLWLPMFAKRKVMKSNPYPDYWTN